MRWQNGESPHQQKASSKVKTQFWNKFKLQKSVFEDSFGYQFSILRYLLERSTARFISISPKLIFEIIVKNYKSKFTKIHFLLFQTIPQALNTLAETQAPPWSPAASQLFSYVEWTVKSVKPPIFGIKITVRDLYYQNFCADELILVKIGLLEFTDLITFRCYFKNERELPQECQDSTIHVTSHSIFDEKSHFSILLNWFQNNLLSVFDWPIWCNIQFDWLRGPCWHFFFKARKKFQQFKNRFDFWFY